MKKNRLGTSDLMISEIGLGCMSIGTEEKKAISILDEAFDKGINYFDTADLYDKGMNEEWVGKALKNKRSEVILATKAGNRWRPDYSGWDWDPSKAYIKEAVKKSLKRLDTDYIDLYQLHGGTTDDPIDETIEAFEELTQEGWIRYYGISSIRPNVIREYVSRSNIVSVMMQYSLLDRRPEETALDLLHEHNISVIARGPVAKGALSEGGADKFPDGMMEYSGEELSLLLQQLQNFVTPERSLSQLALQIVLAHPAVAAVVPGASRVEQLQQNISASASAPLTEAELEQLRQMSKASIYQAHR